MNNELKFPNNYESLVEEAKAILASGKPDSLETLWELGKYAASVDDHDPKAVGRFAADVDVSKQDVVLSMQLRRGFPAGNAVQWIERKFTASDCDDTALIRLRILLVDTYPIARDSQSIQVRLRKAGGKELSWLWRRCPTLNEYTVASMHRSVGAPKHLIRWLLS